MNLLFTHFHYLVAIVLMMTGFFIVIAHQNLIKKLIGLNLFQTSVFIFFITLAKVDGGTAPILDDAYQVYSNPLPHVLILTAIVVGVATTALGLAITVRIHSAYQSLNEREIHQQDEP